MELYNNLRIVRKNIWLVILTTLIAAGAAAGFDRVHHNSTVYVATATLAINPGAPNHAVIDTTYSTNLPDLQTLAASYNSYIASPSFVAAALQSAQPSLNPATVAAHTNGQLLPGTVLDQISVSGPNGAADAQAATALANHFINIDPQNASVPSSSLTVDTGVTSIYDAVITRLQQQQQSIASDSRLSLTEKYNRINALATQIGQAQQQKAQALGNTGTTSSPPPSQAKSAIYLGTAGPVVLVRNVVVANIIGFAALGGFIAGIALALLREYLDTSVRDADEAAGTLGLPVLATLPFVRRLGRRARRGLLPHVPAGAAGGVPAAPLIALDAPFDVGSEAFRNLRTGILFAGAVDGAVDKVRSIAVTSAQPGEGKSIVAANLAVVMAQAGERVILVDANMRRPVQHAFFGLPTASGLSGLYLGDAEGLDAAVSTALQQTTIPNLRLLDAGQIAPNPAELLASARTTAIVAALRAQADAVIFDTPAMGLLTDAVMLASHADGTVMVVRARATRRDLVKTALAKLQATNARVLGIVLTMADQPGAGQARYYGRPRRVSARPAAPSSRAASSAKPITGIEGALPATGVEKA